MSGEDSALVELVEAVLAAPQIGIPLALAVIVPLGDQVRAAALRPTALRNAEVDFRRWRTTRQRRT